MSPESFTFGKYARVRIESEDSTRSNRFLTIALSAQAKEHPDRFIRAGEHHFAIEYTPDPDHPELIREHVTESLKAGIPVRFHCRFFDYELGNADPTKAAKATEVHLRVIDAISGLGEPYVTIHLNLSQSTPFKAETGIQNLTRIVDRGRQNGITVCLENLKRGPTSDPHNVKAWAERSGAMITFDVGHAISSEFVKSGQFTVLDYVECFSSRLREVHMYGKEEDRHYPIEDMIPVRPIVDRLLVTDCAWWTIELDIFEEALSTRKLLLNYLEHRLLTQVNQTDATELGRDE